eukprot:jgi/Tetstr1/461722/TSEL_006812.t1
MNHPRYGICIVLVYVDDILVVSDFVEWIRSVKSAIGAEFNMTDFGEAAFVMGMDLTRCSASGTIRLSQEQYTLELLEIYGMQDCSPAKTPMGSGHYKDLASASDADKAPLSREDHETYRAILGSVNFLTMCTRPDLAFAISVLSRFQSAPQKIHLMQLKRVLRYLKGTPGMGITYGATEPGGARLVVYSDSDWAADTNNRRSQSGDIIMLNGDRPTEADFLAAYPMKPRSVASYSSQLNPIMEFCALEDVFELDADTALCIVRYISWAADRGRSKAGAF